MYNLENDFLKIAIHPKGAELQQLFNKQTNIEHLWSGDAAYWGKYSPILFPIVGTLKDNTYFYKDKKYNLPRHGFARDKTFEVKEKTETSISFSLKDDEETLKVYPFQFELIVTYTLLNNKLNCNYEVKNIGNTEMVFSIGAHPAFAVPFLPNTKYEDYYLQFNNDEQLIRWKLNDGGLISNNTESIILKNKQLPLLHKLFEADAIVMKDLKSTSITLASIKNENGFIFSWNDFPYFGIWSAPNAPFVCLEPWCGIADTTVHNQQLQQKKGINCLMPSHNFNRSWSVECF